MKKALPACVAIFALCIVCVQAGTAASARPIVLIPSGPIASDILPDLADMIKKYHGLEVTLNPAIEINPAWRIPESEQFDAKTLTNYGANIPQQSHSAPFVILVTDHDINSADREYNFSLFLHYRQWHGNFTRPHAGAPFQRSGMGPRARHEGNQSWNRRKNL